MASRPVIIASLLGASVGVPYIASRATTGPHPTGAPTTAISATAAQPAAMNRTAAMPISYAAPVGAPLAAGYPAATATGEGAQFTSVAEVLRFDVTKEWVCRNWPRKSAGPTDVGLFGIRVPLVMGTQMTSLAGSLTYYFSPQGQVEHISFHGTTGDTTQLVQFLTQSYQFQPIQSFPGEKLYQVRSGESIYSELRLQPQAVLRSDAPQQSIAVELEFARPGSERTLPPHGPTLQIPQVPGAPVTGSPPAAESSNGIGASVNSAASNYYQQIRYATPAEEAQLFSKRWPQ